MITVTPTSIYIPTHELKKGLGKKYEIFKDKLKLTHKPEVGPSITYNVAPIHRVNDVFCTRLPRSSLKPLSKIFPIDVRLPKLIPASVEFIGELTECQQLVVNHMMDNVYTPTNIDNGLASTYLDMKAGYGKSYVLGGIIGRLKVKTLVVVGNTGLARQMMNDLKDCLNCTIGMYDGETIKRDGTIKQVKKSSNFDVTIAIINTAIAIPDVSSKYSFIAIDEAQDYCTGTFGKIFDAESPIRLSMSATPDEKPSCFIGIKSAGPILNACDIEGFTYDDVKFDIDVDVIEYHGNPEYTDHILSSIGKMDTRAMHNQLLEDDFRTNLIVDKILNIYNQKIIVPMMDDDVVVTDDDTGEPIMEEVVHCIYVFAEELEHLRKIHKKLSDNVNVWAPELEESIGMFTGGITETQNSHIRQNSRILLTTYGYASKGISMAKMTSLVFLTSRKAKMKQIVARILRRSGDKRIRRRIVDIIDMSTGLKKQFNHRLEAYKYYNANILRSRIVYESP